MTTFADQFAPSGAPRPRRVARAVRRAVHHAEALTRLQRARRAIAWWALGVVCALWASQLYESAHARVELLQPVVEYSDDDLIVTRFRFEWRGITKECRLKVYRDFKTWSVKC